MQNFSNFIAQAATSIGFQLLISILGLLIGWRLIDKVGKLIVSSKKMQTIDQTARTFISSFATIGLKLILIIVCVSYLGIPTASVVALLTTVAAAVGLALQGGLSNIAGGIIILVFKPFKVGDYIVACGEGGTVSEINMFYTVLKTPDNKTVSIPNGSISNSTMQNLSTENMRRVDITVTVDFDANVEGIQALLKQIAANNPLVDSQYTAPFAPITGYSERGVDISLRAWVKGEDYWTVFFQLNEAINEGFEKYGVKFALPKVEVRK